MKPRQLIKIGIVLGEVVFLGIIAVFAAGHFWHQKTDVLTSDLKLIDTAGQAAVRESFSSPTQQAPALPEETAAPETLSVSQADQSSAPENVDAAAPTVECGPPADWVLVQAGEGETLDVLAQMYGAAAADLAKANCLGEAGVVVAGMNLFVPPVAPVLLDAQPTEPAPTLAAEPQAAQPTMDVSPTAQPITQQADTPSPTATVVPTEQMVIEPPDPTPESTEETGTAAEEYIEIDLRNADETSGTYSSNPGMGWQYRGGTFPITTPAETVSYSQRNQISWLILNPAEDVYNWAPLDSQLNLAVSQGKQFSFRVYTMIGESFGGPQVPQWVMQKGAVLLESGEPDYANCTYQQEWGRFVNALRKRYDGNPNIAFIDISGYGNFNEWSWQDQTEWDDAWAAAYANGTAGPSTMSTMDSYARRILADMFIGGSFEGHECMGADNQVETIDYRYDGFQHTQLVMPFAGVIQSTQYVFSKTHNVGFRYDCLGRNDYDIVGRLGTELAAIYPNAPVIYETCKPYQYTTANALYLIENTHPSLIHDVNLDLGPDEIMPLLEPLGYQYSLNHLGYSTRVKAGETLGVNMEWQNDGIAPSYPRMGQNFKIHIYLVSMDGQRAADMVVPVDVSSWMPAAQYGNSPPVYQVNVNPIVPEDVAPGMYSVEVVIVNERTGEPIWLPDAHLIAPRMRGIIVTN